MTSRQIIRNIIEHKKADRVGYSYSPPHGDDFGGITPVKLKVAEHLKEKMHWSEDYQLLMQTNHFKGEVRYDAFGNIYGRMNKLTKGECVKGALENWDDLKYYELPHFDFSGLTEDVKEHNKNTDKYVLACSPFAVFSVLRDVRLMTNALMDLVLETENVELFLRIILERNLELVDKLKDYHVDAVIFYDDWGTQDRTFISPNSFRGLFKPIYKAIADRLHSYNMHLFVHSCGYNYGIMEDFIDAGVDVLQFDQLGAYGYEKMADEFCGRVTFWSPLDVQKTLPTGNRDLIEKEALRMITAFKGKGSLILKDYPSYEDIEVKEEWATWARDVFNANL